MPTAELFIIFQVLAFVFLIFTLEGRQKRTTERGYQLIYPFMSFLLFACLTLMAVDVDPVFATAAERAVTNTATEVLWINAGMAFITFILFIYYMLSNPLEQMAELGSTEAGARRGRDENERTLGQFY